MRDQLDRLEAARKTDGNRLFYLATPPDAFLPISKELGRTGMLKENGAPPQGKWSDIALLEPVRDYKARHASTMLTFDAVVDAIGQIEAKQLASAPS